MDATMGENFLALVCVLHRATHSVQLGICQSRDLHACGHDRQLRVQLIAEYCRAGVKIWNNGYTIIHINGALFSWDRLYPLPFLPMQQHLARGT